MLFANLIVQYFTEKHELYLKVNYLIGYLVASGKRRKLARSIHQSYFTFHNTEN